MIDQIVALRKTLSTEAKPSLTMSFSKGINLIYHPLNYMLFNLLYWVFSFSRLQWYVSINPCIDRNGRLWLFYHFSILLFKFCWILKIFENCEKILNVWNFINILKFIKLFENVDLFCILLTLTLNERVTVKKLLPAEPCVRAECYPRLIQ